LEPAAVSRSAFLSRFNFAFGYSPMALLRKLRLRRAANLFTAETFSIEQIATLAVTPATAVSREFSGKSMRPFRRTI
jgi:transcriptional regulator GlxA family with amidase domain